MADNKIKVIHILSCLDVGGAEVLVLNLLKKLDRTRYSPVVCSLEIGGKLEKEFKDAGIPVYAANKREGIDFSLPMKLAKIIIGSKADIVHTHNMAPWLYGGVASKILSSKILIHTEHANLYNHQRRLILAEYWLAKITDKIIADAKKVADFLSDKENINRNKIQIVFNGVDIDKYDCRYSNAVSKRHELSIADDEVIIGIVARLSMVKDHKNLLDAFSIILNAISNAKLLVIGDGELREDLVAYTRMKGIQERVLFLGNRRDIPELLRLMNVFVLCSISEGLPITLLEAMAAGLPVVATDVGGNREVVIDRKSGFLVPPKDPQRLAEAIATILKDKKMARRFGENGIIRCKELFSLDGMVKKYSELYESVLKKQKK